MPTVSVNPPKTPVTKGSNGIAMATVPNICKMPGPPAPFVPTPLPNIGQSGKSPQGYSTSVTIEGAPVAIQGASFGSSGDVASQGTGGGLISSNVEGPTKFIGPGSFDVKIEGKNVQFLGDPMMNNCGPSGSTANAATMTGELQAALPAGKWDIQCVLDILCKQDKVVVEKAKKMKIVQVNPLMYDDPIFKGGKWTTVEFPAAGTQNRGEIQMVRNMSCEEAAITLYHEMIHAEQPDAMPWSEKEYDAYTRTEQWTIDRGLSSQQPDFRTLPPPPPVGPPGPLMVDRAAIKSFVDREYPLAAPSTPGGPIPPQVVDKSADGKLVRLDDDTWRPVKEGDRFPAKHPRNPAKPRQIPPEQFKCP